MPYLFFNETIRPHAASYSTLLHTSSSMIYSQAFELHENNLWWTQRRKKSFDILLVVVLCSIRWNPLLSIHSMLPWKRLKATLPIYVNKWREKKYKDGRENRKIYSLMVVVPCCYVRQAKYRWELCVLRVCMHHSVTFVGTISFINTDLVRISGAPRAWFWWGKMLHFKVLVMDRGTALTEVNLR